MGHRHDAVEALRAYVADLETTIIDGADGRAGHPVQSSAATSGRVIGAPHPGLITGVAGVALVGLIGVPAALGFLGAAPGRSSDTIDPSPAATAATERGPAVTTGGARAIRAVHRLSAVGLTDAAGIVSLAIVMGVDRDPDVDAAIEALMAAVDEAGAHAADDVVVRSALAALMEATRPPGLTPDRLPPGRSDDTVPPGRDDTFTPPGRDDTFTPPGRDDTFTPPGRDDTFTPPGWDETFTPPGRDGTGAAGAGGDDRSGVTPEEGARQPKDGSVSATEVKETGGGADR
jgi:hypothetical protein